MRVQSNLKTGILYDGGDSQYHLPASERHRVEIRPGINVLADADADVLAQDRKFAKHVEAGHMGVLPDADPEPAPVAVTEEAPAPVDPRTKLPGETKKAYEARLKALDAPTQPPEPETVTDTLTAEERQYVTDFYAMTEEEQNALKATLSPEEAKLLDDNKPVKE